MRDLDKTKVYDLSKLSQEQRAELYNKNYIDFDWEEVDVEYFQQVSKDIVYFIEGKWDWTDIKYHNKSKTVDARELFDGVSSETCDGEDNGGDLITIFTDPKEVTSELTEEIKRSELEIVIEAVQNTNWIIRGNYYFYKDNFYQVTGFSETKDKVSGEWYDSVTYKQSGTGNNYTRCLKDFKSKFKK